MGKGPLRGIMKVQILEMDPFLTELVLTFSKTDWSNLLPMEENFENINRFRIAQFKKKILFVPLSLFFFYAQSWPFLMCTYA